MVIKSVLSVLKEGLIVSTRFSKSSTWHQNIIYKVKNNLVYTALTESYLENIIMLGSNMVIKYSNEYFEYIYEGVVSDISTESPAHIVLQINKSEEVINTRAFPRYDIYLAANIRPLEDPCPYFSIATNISLSGMAFAARYEFDYSEENGFNLLLPSQQKICAKGKIIRKSAKKDYFDYSMQFTDMDDANSTMLLSYLKRLEEKANILRSNYEKSIKNKFLI